MRSRIGSTLHLKYPTSSAGNVALSAGLFAVVPHAFESAQVRVAASPLPPVSQGEHSHASTHVPAPVLAAVTPTAGGVVFAADMGGNAYAFDAETGAVLWRTSLDGAAGGGVITYANGGRQYVAFAAGTNSPIWPVEKKSAKIVVFGLQ